MSNSEENSILGVIEIPNYPEYVQLSKSRRATYYKKGDKIPKKYMDKTKFNFNTKGTLVSVIDDSKVIKNSKSVHTPKNRKINGQDIWVGMHYALRNKIAGFLKGFFKRKFREAEFPPIKKSDYPISIRMDFYKPIEKANWDIDNHALVYRKCLLDGIKGTIIEDDSVLYVRGIPSFYHPCEKKDQRLVITIYKLSDDF